MPMSCDHVLVLWGPVEQVKRGKADLKDVLERVSYFLPFVDKVFMSLAHDEVQVLVCLAGHEDIMQDAFLVLRECSPAIAVQSVEQRETRSV